MTASDVKVGHRMRLPDGYTDTDNREQIFEVIVVTPIAATRRVLIDLVGLESREMPCINCPAGEDVDAWAI